jgi:hypothetical protein
MDTTDTRVAIDRILAENLSSLARSGSLSVVPPTQIEEWHLPQSGKAVASSHGLPSARTDDLMGIVGGFQESVVPEAGPDGMNFYVLGHYGTSRVVAVENSGVVIAIPKFSEVHPGLASVYPSGISTTWVNSSIERFVECAWRWHWIVALLAEEQMRAGEGEILAWRDGQGDRQGDRMVDAYAKYEELCRYVLERFRSIDEDIDVASNFWPDVIMDIS